MTENKDLKPSRVLTPEEESASRTRRAFITMGVAGIGAWGGWYWLRTRPQVDSLASPLRRTLQFNERIARVYGEARLAPTFSPDEVQKMRVNGDIGLGDDFDPAVWNLTINHLTKQAESRPVGIREIHSLPRTEHTTQLKCIEGWSVIAHWAGARFSDFTAAFAPQSTGARYVSMQTPDEEYFVGLDMASAMHPQTLLCYEMNGTPITLEHGAPLRLAIPVKYGIKNIKRVSTITYTNERPADYWAKEGYDWDAGL